MNKNQWNEYINSLETDFDNLETNKIRAKRILKDQLIKVVKKNAVNNCGVLFSGGIDSTLISFILKKLNVNFNCYVVGLENAQDIEWAEKVATTLNFKLKTEILALNKFEEIIKKVVGIIKEPDVMKVSVGSVLLAAILLAKQENVNVLFSGLGSEELFAGYQRHEEALKNGFKAIHKECLSGLKNMWERDIKRDLLITKATNIELKLPFLEKEFVKYAMTIHPMYKIDKDTKKIIIREVAQELGIPQEFAWRKKKAAQYGSNFVKGLDKLTKKNGFKMKKDYLLALIKEKIH